MTGDLPDRLQTIVVAHLSCADRFAWDAELVADLGADSLDTVELQQAVEEAFGLTISDTEAETWTTPGDILASVQQCMPVEVEDDEMGAAIDG